MELNQVKQTQVENKQPNKATASVSKKKFGTTVFLSLNVDVPEGTNGIDILSDLYDRLDALCDIKMKSIGAENIIQDNFGQVEVKTFVDNANVNAPVGQPPVQMKKDFVDHRVNNASPTCEKCGAKKSVSKKTGNLYCYPCYMQKIGK